VKIEALREDDLRKKGFKTLMATSGATNTSLIEDEPFYFVHGGREADAFELGADSSFVVCIGNISSFKDINLTGWGTCLWQGNKFGRMIPSASKHLFSWPAMFFEPVIALSRSVVEEPAVNVENINEGVFLSSGFNQETEFEALPWRGTLCLAHTEKILFSQKMEFRTAELPRWKPHLIIDRRRPERVNE